MINCFFLGAFIHWSYGAEPNEKKPVKEQRKYSQKAEATATIRIGKHENFIRIVFEVTEEAVQKASVILSGENNIRIEFHHPMEFRIPQKDDVSKGRDKGWLKREAPFEAAPGVRLSLRSNSCMITVANLDDINVSKLSSPHRLVVDAYVRQSPEGPSEKKIPEMPEVAFESFVIDPGHGGSDNGLRQGNILEKDLTLSLAKEISNVIGRRGGKFSFTRKGDQSLAIKERIRIANQKPPDMFISIHVSSGNELIVYTASKARKEKTEARSSEIRAGAGQMDTQKQLKNNRDIMDNVLKRLAQQIGKDLGIVVRQERLSLPVVAYVNAPAVMIELPNAGKFSYDKKTKEKLAQSIVKAIVSSPQKPVQKGQETVNAQ